MIAFLLLFGFPPAAGAQPTSADRFVADRFVFISADTANPVRLVLTFARGTAEREQREFAAECTGHLFIENIWTNLGPGRYESPETTLAVVPQSDRFQISQSPEPPAWRIRFTNRPRPFEAVVDCLDFVAEITVDPDYQVVYDAGPGTLALAADTIRGTVVHSRQDFTGYNRLANNTQGYFPGKHELMTLVDPDGAVFLFAADPVARGDTDGRVATHFGACRLPSSETTLVRDSISITWPVAADSLYPGKPIPQTWEVRVRGESWRAELADRGHFFYFTGYGQFSVRGIVEFGGRQYQVCGTVEHIHARNETR